MKWRDWRIESKIESQRDYWLGWASGVIGALIGAGLMGWLS